MLKARAGLEAAGEVVEIPQPGGQPGHHTVAALPGVDILHHLLDQPAYRDHLLAHPPLGELEELLLHLVQDHRGFGLLPVAAVDHLGRGGDQFPQQGLLGDDFEMSVEVGGGGDVFQKGDDVLFPPRRLQVPPFLQGVHQGDGVGRGPAIVKGDDGVVDLPVGVLVEGFGGNPLHHPGDYRLVEQHRPQDALFRVEVAGLGTDGFRLGFHLQVH